MCEAFPVRFSVGSSCKTRQVRRRKDKERSAVVVTAWLTRSLLYMARVVPSSSSSNCECCAAVPKRRRVQAACRSCVPKLCQIITPVPEDLRTTSTLLAPKPPQRSSATNGKPYSPLLMSVGGGLSAPSQAVSYHVTSLLAASQLLVTRGNAALGSHLLLLCLDCGVRSLGPTQ